jgi:hypothetical protein
MSHFCGTFSKFFKKDSPPEILSQRKVMPQHIKERLEAWQRRKSLPQADLNLESKHHNAHRRKDILLTQVINSASESNKKKREKVVLLMQVDEVARRKKKFQLLEKKEEAQKRQELFLLSRKEKAMEANVLVEERVQEVQRERSFSQSELACKIDNKLCSSEIRNRRSSDAAPTINDKFEKVKALKLVRRSSLSFLKEKLENRIQDASERRALNLQTRAAKASNDKKAERVDLKRKDEELRGLEVQSNQRERLETAERNRNLQLSSKKPSFRTKDSTTFRHKTPKKMLSEEGCFAESHSQMPGSDDKLEKVKAFKLEQRSSLTCLKEKLEHKCQDASERRALNIQTIVAKASNDKKAKSVDLKRKEEELRGLEVQSNQRERLETAERNRNLQLSSKKPSFRTKDSPSFRRETPKKMLLEETESIPISYMVSSSKAVATSVIVEETVCSDGTFMFSLTMFFGWFVDKIRQFVWKK